MPAHSSPPLILPEGRHIHYQLHGHPPSLRSRPRSRPRKNLENSYSLSELCVAFTYRCELSIFFRELDIFFRELSEKLRDERVCVVRAVF
jgi:hypothetical protein